MPFLYKIMYLSMTKTIANRILFVVTLTTCWGVAMAQQGAAPAPDLSAYGGKMGVGISLFNGFGVPLRYYISPKNVAEIGFYTGGVAILDDSGSAGLEIESYEPGFMVGVGYSRFGDKFLKEKRHKRKVRAHGAALRYQHLFGNFKTGFLSLGWAMETSKEKKPHRSFIFELGLQGAFPNFVYDGQLYNNARPGLYLRCHWNFFID